MLHKMLIFKRGIDFSSVRRQTLFPTLFLGEEGRYCGGTGMDSTIPTNTRTGTDTTGTVMDSGSEYTGFISDIV